MNKPALNENQVEEVINHYKSGLFMREIAKLYGVSNTTIKNYLKKNGVTLKNPKQEISRFGKTRILDKNPFWNGGRVKLGSGYIRINLGNNRKMLEHRYIMEQHVGRTLVENEHVHHINGIKDDNRIENLQLMTASEHSSLTGNDLVKSGKHNAYKHIEKEELEKLVIDGLDYKAICARYKISSRTFYNKLEKMNLKNLYMELRKHA